MQWSNMFLTSPSFGSDSNFICSNLFGFFWKVCIQYMFNTEEQSLKGFVKPILQNQWSPCYKRLYLLVRLRFCYFICFFSCFLDHESQSPWYEFSNNSWYLLWCTQRTFEAFQSQSYWRYGHGEFSVITSPSAGRIWFFSPSLPSIANRESKRLERKVMTFIYLPLRILPNQQLVATWTYSKLLSNWWNVKPTILGILTEALSSMIICRNLNGERKLATGFVIVVQSSCKRWARNVLTLPLLNLPGKYLIWVWLRNSPNMLWWSKLAL